MWRSPRNATKAARYPDLLNRYLVAKIIKAVEANRKARPSPVILPLREDDQELNVKQADTTNDPTAPQAIARFSFSEAIRWQNPTGGQTEKTAKQIADSLAIGGLRNTAWSVNKMQYLYSSGSKSAAS